MNLAIDCFRLIKDDQSKNGIYELTVKLIQYLGNENSRRDMEHHIMVMGNTTNQCDMDVDGVSFLLMEGDPRDRISAAWWQKWKAGAIAKKLGCDRIFFPEGRLPLLYKGRKTIMIYEGRSEKDKKLSYKLISAARRSDHIIVIHEATRNKLIEAVPGIEDRIRLLKDLGTKDRNPMELGGYWIDLFSD